MTIKEENDVRLGVTKKKIADMTPEELALFELQTETELMKKGLPIWAGILTLVGCIVSAFTVMYLILHFFG